MLTFQTKSKIREALKEDVGAGDLTSECLIEPKVRGKAVILSKEAGVFCGTEVVREVMKSADQNIKLKFLIREGQIFRPRQTLIQFFGPLRGILRAERTTLNFLGHLCGIAAKTQRFVQKVKKYNVKILDTRKTTPLWRELEKYAVKTGGGTNHRMGLYDAVFVKENHRKYGHLGQLRHCAKKFEIEVRNIRELMEALMLQPRVILLDNFKPSDLKQAVRIARACNPQIILEASGGITLENVEAYAKTGVNQISIGSLTHSVKAIDLSLLIA